MHVTRLPALLKVLHAVSYWGEDDQCRLTSSQTPDAFCKSEPTSHKIPIPYLKKEWAAIQRVMHLLSFGGALMAKCDTFELIMHKIYNTLYMLSLQMWKKGGFCYVRTKEALTV